MENHSIIIQNIIHERKQQLPYIQKQISFWETTEKQIEELMVSILALKEKVRPEQEIINFNTREIKIEINSILNNLTIAETRFNRNTINIGVSGRARVGKSTLLQSISGLDDQQIPTGKGLPVTAVRSRIFHSSLHQRASVSFHNFSSFRDEVLKPYHEELAIYPIPSSIENFKSHKYPEHRELTTQIQEKHSSVVLLKRLKDMQKSISSYENDLDGRERIINLQNLKPYVSYPTNDELKNLSYERKYLAVRDVKIECSFPYAQVQNLGIVDLPGLGELASNAEEHHLNGLQNEVDLVLLVKRPVEGMSYWGREDGNAVDLLDKARGPIQLRSDFVFIIINQGKDSDPKLVQDLKDDIHRSVNDGKTNKYFNIINADCQSKESTYQDILRPILSHLSQRLPIMDREILDHAQIYSTHLLTKLSNLIEDVEKFLLSIRNNVGSSAEDLDERVEILHQDLAEKFHELVKIYRDKVDRSDGDYDYLDSIEKIYQNIHHWISQGYDIGPDEWQKLALRKMRVLKNSSPVASEELNSIRVSISQKYCEIDLYFKDQTNQLYQNIFIVLQQHLGNLLEDQNIDLNQFEDILKNAYEPCPNLASSLRELLNLRLDYRTHLHPKMRKELEFLNFEVKDIDEIKAQIIVPIDSQGSALLYKKINQLANRAAYAIRCSLMEDPLLPSNILYAAIEHFEDSFIRSTQSKKELKRLARSYRNEIWPNVYQGIDEANSHYVQIQKNLQNLKNSIHLLSTRRSQ